MISKNNYKKILTATYAFYIGLSLTWFLVSFFVGSYVNYISLLTFGIFCTQAWYRHRVANLALGIIVLPASIFGALYFLAWGGNTGFDAFINVMLALSVTSIVLSIFLVFSYLKMSFNTD